MTNKELKTEYERILEELEYSLHELPCGVLYGANGANERQCREFLDDTYRLEELSIELGIDISEFIKIARWHFERYPHYLGRQRHFGTYIKYIEKHNGPLFGK